MLLRCRSVLSPEYFMMVNFVLSFMFMAYGWEYYIDGIRLGNFLLEILINSNSWMKFCYNLISKKQSWEARNWVF